MDNRREEPNPAYEQYLLDIDNAPAGQATAYPEFDIFLGHVASPPRKLTVACAYGQEAGAIQIAVDAAIQDEDGEFAQAGIAEMTLGDFLDAFTKSLTNPMEKGVALGFDPGLPTVLPTPADARIEGSTAVAAQPAPVDQGRASAHDLVSADMQERKAFGLRKYGVTLQAHNGRDTLQDAYEEVLDLAVYLRTLIEERKG